MDIFNDIALSTINEYDPKIKVLEQNLMNRPRDIFAHHCRGRTPCEATTQATSCSPELKTRTSGRNCPCEEYNSVRFLLPAMTFFHHPSASKVRNPTSWLQTSGVSAPLHILCEFWHLPRGAVDQVPCQTGGSSPGTDLAQTPTAQFQIPMLVPKLMLILQWLSPQEHDPSSA